MVTVETGLNLVWAILAAAALLMFMTSEWRRRRGAAFASRCRRGLAVFVVTVALFPTLSVSDDLVRFEAMQVESPLNSQIRSPQTADLPGSAGLYLARLSDALESSQTAPFFGIALGLCFFVLVAESFEQGRDRSLPSFSSRAPPLACCA
jgi:hypothetical protein